MAGSVCSEERSALCLKLSKLPVSEDEDYFLPAWPMLARNVAMKCIANTLVAMDKNPESQLHANDASYLPVLSPESQVQPHGYGRVYE